MLPSTWRLECWPRFGSTTGKGAVFKPRTVHCRIHRVRLVSKAVITPPEVSKSPDAPPAPPASANPSTDLEQPGNLWSLVSDTTNAITSQLYGQLRFWPDLEALDGKLREQRLQPTGQVLEDASRSIREEHARTQPADISNFLQVNDVKTIKLLRSMSAMCGLTYKMDLVTPASLKRRFKVDLVTTSKACELCVFDNSQRADEIAAEGDGMAVSVNDVRDVVTSLSCIEENNIVVLPKDVALSFLPAEPPIKPSSKAWNPADLVQQKLAEAAAAASAAAIAPLGSAAAKLYKATQTLMTGPIPSPALYLASKFPNVADFETGYDARVVCPSEWFVCDDVDRQVRYFVIQGSDTIDHWKCNLTFDPVIFEDPALGVKVHRGMYYAALSLYDRFLPLVQEHLESSPFARVCFTGHSLGGSLGTLLLLMYRWRNVISPGRAMVYTFGAPAVFCDSSVECGCGGKCGPCSDVQDDSESGSIESDLLTSMQLNETDVCNVLMHRDIVPRAFACNYAPVAEILKSWGPAFRQHCCLQGDPRSMLYYFVGKVMVLQPDENLTWANSEPYHPMLPEGQELYTLAEPAILTGNDVSASLSQPRRQAKNLRAAITELMDTPHPLEILYDANSWGPNGAISRYHNPDNYTRALGTLIQHKKQQAARYLATRSAPHLSAEPVVKIRRSSGSEQAVINLSLRDSVAQLDSGSCSSVNEDVIDVPVEPCVDQQPEVQHQSSNKQSIHSLSLLPFIVRASPNVLWPSKIGKPSN